MERRGSSRKKERKKINCHAPTFDTNSTTSWTIIIYYYYYYYYYILYIIVQYNFTFCVQYTVQYTINYKITPLLCMYIKHIYEISTISALTTDYIEIYTTAHSDHQQHNSIWKTVNIHVTVLHTLLQGIREIIIYLS